MAPKSILHRAILFSFLLLLAWLFFLKYIRWASFDELVWLTLLFIVCGLPGILFIGGHRLRVPVMPLWGAGYFLLFGMPFLGKAEESSLFGLSADTVQKALRLVVLGAACCLAAFYTPVGSWVEKIIPKLQTPWDLRRASKSGVSLCLIGLITHYGLLTGHPSPGLRQLFSTLSRSSTLGMLTLFLLQLRGKLSFRLKGFLWGFIFPVEYLLGLGTGAVYNAVIVLAPFLFCYTAERRKFPIVSAALLAAVLVVPFLGFKAEYRSYAWNTEGSEIAVPNSPVQRGLFFVQLVFNRLTQGGVASYTAAVKTSQERTSCIALLASVMEMTPGYVPFWHGETYASLAWIFLPRLFFPDKPTKTLGQEFGHRYEILNEEDDVTSINLPHQVVEMYVNFGALGVLAGMTLIGLLYRSIAVFLGRTESGERAMLIGCTICAILLNLDSDFSLVFGGVAYCLAVLYLVSHVFHGRSSVAA